MSNRTLMHSNLKKLALYASLALTSVTLISCGGGGDVGICGYDYYGDPIFCSIGGPGTQPNNPPVASSLVFPLATAMHNILTQSYAYNIWSQDQYGNSYEIVYSAQPGGATQINGSNALASVVNQNYSQNGAYIGNISITNYFPPQSNDIIVSSENQPGGYSVTTSTQPLPQTAQVGQGFNYQTANIYRDNTQAVLDGTLSVSIGMQPDTATTALLCYNNTVQPNQNGLNDGLSGQQTANCFRIDASGNVLGVEMSTVIYGMPLTFQ